MPLLRQTIWDNIWKRTVEKSQTNATNVTMPLLRQTIWDNISKRTADESQINATNVIMLLLGQAIWGNIWRHIVEKSPTNATNVTMPLLRQLIWGDIWKRTVEKCHFDAIWGHIWKHKISLQCDSKLGGPSYFIQILSWLLRFLFFWTRWPLIMKVEWNTTKNTIKDGGSTVSIKGFSKLLY